LEDPEQYFHIGSLRVATAVVIDKRSRILPSCVASLDDLG
jgi:hypothetical protein